MSRFKLAVNIEGTPLVYDNTKCKYFFSTTRYPLSTGRFSSVINAVKALKRYRDE